MVLPAPFGPTMPTRSPRMMRVEKSRTTARSPYDFDTRSATATSRPDRSACAASSRTVPWAPRCSFRCLRSACRSAEPLLVALAPRGDAIAQPVLLHRDLAAELVLLAFLLLQHRVAPGLERRETLVQRAGDAAVEPDGGARDALQQPPVMADQHDAGAHARPVRCSSHSMPGRSRWLVGSSSSRMSGEGASTRASAARRASPPDSVAGPSSPVRPSCSSR